MCTELRFAHANATALRVDGQRWWLASSHGRADALKAWAAHSQAQRDAGRYEGMLAEKRVQLSSMEQMIASLKTLLGERLGQRGGGASPH